MRVLLVTESPFLENFCNTYQQLTLYGVVFLHGYILLIKGLVLKQTQAESDMVCGCVAVSKFSLLCGCTKLERFLVFKCHYFL